MHSRDPAGLHRPAGGRPHLVGRLRGPRAGVCSCRRSACSARDGRARPHARPSSARSAGCRWTAPRRARCSTATGCGSSAASCRVVVHEPRPDRATRAHADRAAAQLAAGRRRRLRRRDRRRTPPGRRRSQLDDDGWQRAGEHLREIAELAAARRARARAAPARRHARRDRRPTSSARSRTPTCRWCFDTGHLLIGGVDPVDFVRPTTRERIGHVHLKDVDAALAGARARGRAVARAGHAGRPVPAAGQTGTRGSTRSSGLLDRPGTSAGSCSSRTLAITGSEPPVGERSGARCRARASSSCPPWLRRRERCSTDEARRQRRSPGLALVVAVVAAGCERDDDERQHGLLRRAATTSRSRRAADLTFAMVTHSDEGSFWSVVKKGAEQAAKDEGVKLIWSPSNNDPQKEAQLIDAAVSQKVDGLAVSVPNADAIKGSLAQGARRAGIPIITLNSGARRTPRSSARSPTSARPRRSPARPPAPSSRPPASRRCSASSTSRATSASQQRCDGVKKGFGGDVTNLQVKGTEDIATTQTEIKSKLQADKSFDGVIDAQPGHRARRPRPRSRARARSAKLATFDLSPAIIKDIEAGTVLFAVDQQQYLQGYLPIVFLKLFKQNANTVGGGQPVLTGPGFVDKSNAATVEKLARARARGDGLRAGPPRDVSPPAAAVPPPAPLGRRAAGRDQPDGAPPAAPRDRRAAGRRRRGDLLLDPELAVPQARRDRELDRRRLDDRHPGGRRRAADDRRRVRPVGRRHDRLGGPDDGHPRHRGRHEHLAGDRAHADRRDGDRVHQRLHGHARPSCRASSSRWRRSSSCRASTSA